MAFRPDDCVTHEMAKSPAIDGYYCTRCGHTESGDVFRSRAMVPVRAPESEREAAARQFAMLRFEQRRAEQAEQASRNASLNKSRAEAVQHVSLGRTEALANLAHELLGDVDPQRETCLPTKCETCGMHHGIVDQVVNANVRQATTLHRTQNELRQLRTIEPDRESARRAADLETHLGNIRNELADEKRAHAETSRELTMVRRELEKLRGRRHGL